ncbi:MULTISPECIES: toxin-antitoxin system, toxin component [unclassified Streptomyces]|uniref:toxin-antitoxin system, toxin component n=1 Tax=unclassified Streptomyces TaxID=2593676 RepID=UPI00109EB50C|nr:toxin-antitoxin system, toxin component [Streptomyces sp. A1136]THA44312.1 toxin-antitoxin system, toxin component [Streptomyces sp. A1136]
MGKRKMIRLRNEILANLGRPIPSDPDELFESLRVFLERRFNEVRGNGTYRPVHLLFREFPEETASGLTLTFDDRMVIVVERHTTTLHQLVILAHEMWHALMGKCLTHGAQPDAVSAAARSLGGELEQADILALAARTHFDTREENDAEAFGLLLGSSCREILESGATSLPNTGLAGRIQSSMGRGF